MKELDDAIEATDTAKLAARTEDAFEYRWERVAAFIEGAERLLQLARQEARVIERRND